MKQTAIEVRNKFESLSNRKKVEILEEAIDHMRFYNGRSKIDCIAFAMGYQQDNDGNYVKDEPTTD